MADFSPKTHQIAIDESLSLLRDYQRDHYLAILLIKNPKSRGALSLIYGFNAEITRIPFVAKEPMMGEIRMTWWREVFEGKRLDEAQGNPLAHGLLKVIDHYALSPQDFINLIEARRFDLYQDPMPSLNDFEGYAGECYSKLLQMSAVILAKDSDVDLSGFENALADACGHGGVALCFCERLKNIASDASSQRQYMPTDLIKAAGTTQQALFAGEQSQENQNLLEHMFGLVEEHLKQARDKIQQLPKAIQPAFRGLSLCRFDKRLFEKKGFLLLREPTSQNPFRRQWALWRGKI